MTKKNPVKQATEQTGTVVTLPKHLELGVAAWKQRLVELALNSNVNPFCRGLFSTDKNAADQILGFVVNNAKTMPSPEVALDMYEQVLRNEFARTIQQQLTQLAVPTAVEEE